MVFKELFKHTRMVDCIDVPPFTGNEGKALFVNIMGTEIEYADPAVGVSTSVQGGESTTVFLPNQNVSGGNSTSAGSTQYSGGGV